MFAEKGKSLSGYLPLRDLYTKCHTQNYKYKSHEPQKQQKDILSKNIILRNYFIILLK